MKEVLPQYVVPQEITDLIRGTPIERLIDQRVQSEAWKKVGVVDRLLAQAPQQEMPLHHIFTPKLYSRSIFLKAGTLATTRIHLFEHPFVISAGVLSAWSDEKGWEVLGASHIGVTKAGTRRILYIHEDTIWHTFHVTEETDPDKLVDLLTMDPIDLGHLDDLPPEQLEVLRMTAKTKRELP